jgi:hypothetical protein
MVRTTRARPKAAQSYFGINPLHETILWLGRKKEFGSIR